jgi:hypothetical protein
MFNCFKRKDYTPKFYEYFYLVRESDVHKTTHSHNLNVEYIHDGIGNYKFAIFKGYSEYDRDHIKMLPFVRMYFDKHNLFFNMVGKENVYQSYQDALNAITLKNHSMISILFEKHIAKELSKSRKK